MITCHSCAAWHRVTVISIQLILEGSVEPGAQVPCFLSELHPMLELGPEARGWGRGVRKGVKGVLDVG